MMKLIKNAFNKKDKKKKKQRHSSLFQQQQELSHKSQLQFEIIDQEEMDKIEKSNSLNFQIIDQDKMDYIQREYEQKQQQFSQQDNSLQKSDESDQEVYLEYEVQQDDSLFGIALKFNINIDYLRQINSLSSDFLYKGMTLKMPSSNLPRFSLSQRVSSINEKPQNQLKFDDIFQSHKGSMKFSFYYCTNLQNISGIMTITDDVILFDPDADVIQQDTNKKKQSVTRYNTCISMQDINEVVYYVIQNNLGQKDYLVQILLSGIGKREFELKYKKLLQRYKEEKRSIATIFFRHKERDEFGKVYTEEKKKENCILISQYVTNICVGYPTQYQTLTKIPFIDLVDNNSKLNSLINQEEEASLSEIIGERMGKLWAGLDYVPQLQEDSHCLNETMYKQLIESVPAVFRLAKWYIRFQIDEDGSSFRYMLMELKYQCPFILILKDTDGRVFGGYISNELKVYHEGFFGNGETYLFNFNDKFEIITYRWTEKNKDFTFCDNSGLGIGCGEKFGIFIDKSLEFGYCNQCETFDNPRFTEYEKFKIKHLEVWCIQLQ